MRESAYVERGPAGRRGDAGTETNTCVTFVSIGSTYTQNLSKNGRKIDTFARHVDDTDTFAAFVDF